MIETEYWQGCKVFRQPRSKVYRKNYQKLLGSNGLVEVQRTENRTGDPRFLEGLLGVLTSERIADLYPKADNKTEPLAEQKL